MKIYQIDSSARKEGSTSRALAKKVLEKIKKTGHSSAAEHTFENRPWGKFENILDTKICKVKKLTINPGQHLSLQYHKKRSEHWIVVQGKASVKLNDKNIIYEPKEKVVEVIIDRTSLIRIITNLVKNSIQATKSLEIPSIKVSVYQNDKNAIIDVSDNGEGIPSNLKAKIFEPRFTTKSKGMGLGLSIINNLATAHSGKITFTSKKGKTNFRVSFPKISKKD